MNFISFHKIKSRAISLIAACSVCFSMNAQQVSTTLSAQTDSLAQFVRNIVTFNSMFAQEKVYLHFDNTGYFMGETIWFKAYVVNPSTNRPNILSRVLYVELLTPEGRVLQTNKLKIENGQCNGQFSLKELLHPGFYEVRAYTSVMLNWPDAPIFSRVFPIFNAPISKGEDMYQSPKMATKAFSERLPDMREKKEKLEQINVQFFPEGGHMIEGVKGNIAYKITDKNGNSLHTKATIHNHLNEQLATTQTLHQGMGTFALTPQAGETYYLKVTDENGKAQQIPLPTATRGGYAMNIDNLNKEEMTIHITRSEQADTTQALGLTFMCRGRIFRFDQIKWNGESTYSLTIAKDSLPEGVNQVTLFDTEGRVYAERLAFIPPTQQIKFSLTGEKSTYKPKENIELKFKLEDMQGNPLYTMFSLAVRDADTDTPTNSTNGGGIMANLLLGSELKGYIHDIDYYFESDDDAHRQALDLLMCTQGWRRYDWTQMSHPQDFEVKYPAEEGILILGDLTSTFRKRAKDGAEIQVYLYNGSGQNLRGTCIADSVGKFAFQSEDFYGRWIMSILTLEDEKLKEMNVNLKKTPSPVGRIFADTETQLFTPQEEIFSAEANIDTLLAEEDMEISRWENLLPTIEVESDKEWQSEFVRKWHNMIYEMEEERMRMDETGEYYLREFYRWLEDTNPFFTFDIDSTNALIARYKGRPVRFFVRRTGTGSWVAEKDVSIDIETLTIQDVEAIAISDKPNVERAMMRYGLDSVSNDNSVVITIFVRNDYFRRGESKGMRNTKIQGFTHAIQFYMPDYSFTELPDEEDFRRTLFWAPYVVTNKQGEATVNFFNSPLCKRIKVSAETITFGGLMGSFEK